MAASSDVVLDEFGSFCDGPTASALPSLPPLLQLCRTFISQSEGSIYCRTFISQSEGSIYCTESSRTYEAYSFAIEQPSSRRAVGQSESRISCSHVRQFSGLSTGSVRDALEIRSPLTSQIIYEILFWEMLLSDCPIDESSPSWIETGPSQDERCSNILTT